MKVDKLLTNRLLLVSIAAVAAYWLTGAIVPGPVMTTIVGFMLLAFGGLTFAYYARPAYGVVVLGHRSNFEADGARWSHLGVYGAWLMSAGAVWSGIFRLVWVYHGTPDAWTGTVYSAFGSAIMAVGFLLMYFAPQSTEKGLRMSGTLWVAGAILLGICAGFLFGTQLKPIPDTPLLSKISRGAK
ncbi:hypothetical protein LH464_04495 [Neorhizobium sp. T786]|uniref:hypothetical protein n=1 Tax=Pseudorhizobium xiangyangii TaxID=2883104 RepID=UPI001CFF6DF1|nr:hypothetical protein [Neorhizobium xiangyangii]MCB5201738.1 hypothetical protein [Neorhizobium xiangyangii]